MTKTTKKTATKTAKVAKNIKAKTLTKRQATIELGKTKIGSTLAKSVNETLLAIQNRETALIEAEHQDGKIDSGTKKMVSAIGEIQQQQGKNAAHDFIELIYISNGWGIRNKFDGDVAPNAIQNVISNIRWALDEGVSLIDADSVYKIKQIRAGIKNKNQPVNQASPPIKTFNNIVEVRANAMDLFTSFDTKINELKQKYKEDNDKNILAQIEAASVQLQSTEYELLIADIQPSNREAAHKAAINAIQAASKLVNEKSEDNVVNLSKAV